MALLLTGVLLGACATRSPRPGHPSELRLNSEKNYIAFHGPLVPGIKGAAAVSGMRVAASHLARLAPGLLRILKTDATLKLLEDRLLECARQADLQVNLPRVGDRSPTRQECQQHVGVDRCGNPITQAMELGRLKHALALACARAVLKELWPGPISIEQRYRFYQSARLIETISSAEEQRLIAQNCTGELWRTIKPDLVLHANWESLLKSEATFDFKFPCPDSNQTRWRTYGPRSAYAGLPQGDVYQQALGGPAVLISPKGIPK